MSVTPIGRPLRVAMVSMHTSPSDSPGTGDAGGLNVYIARTSERLARAGATVDVFTRARSTYELAPVQLTPGVTIRGVAAGPLGPVVKDDLAGLVSPFASELLRLTRQTPGRPYDLVHSHYWLSGQVGVAAAERWGVPLIHTMHTMGRVKNAALAGSDAPEPEMRILAERDLVRRADGLIANTFDEGADLIREYDADPGSVHVVWPGVDLTTFRPGSTSEARARVGLPARGFVLLFVGRIQPLKAPDHLIRMAAELIAANPDLRGQLSVVICGGLSGSGNRRPDALVELADRLGISDLVRFEPPAGPRELADWYRAADLTVMPSYSESFGLVALESQACGTPVLAADVGGLRTAVEDGRGGRLVAGRELREWTRELGDILEDDRRRRTMSVQAVAHAQSFDWSNTARDTLAIYREAMDRARRPIRVAASSGTER